MLNKLFVSALWFTGLLSAMSAAAVDMARCDTPAQDASRIAIAGGSITEILYDLGMADRIVAVDRTSNYPPAALELPSVGYVRNLSAEGLLSLQPTLILGEDDMGPVEVLDQLLGTGLEVRQLKEVHTAQGILDKITCVANIVGASQAALEELRSRLDPILQGLDKVDIERSPRAMLLFSLADGVPTAGGADTSANGVLRMAGGANVFTEFEGWKPVSLEAMADANPEIIVMPQRGLDGAGGVEGVLSHPAVKLTDAGQNGRVLAIDGMTLLGFGPRTLGAALELAREFGTTAE